MSILTCFFAGISVFHCSFVNIEDYIDDGWFGLFLYENHHGDCQKYDSEVEFLSAQKVARAFGVLLMIFMPCILVATAISTFFLGNGRIGQATWMSIRILALISIVCQSLTFFFVKDWEAYGNEYNRLGRAGRIAVANVILLVCLSVLVWSVPPREEAMNKQYKSSEKRVKPQPGKTEVFPPQKPDVSTPTQPICYKQYEN
mmetsp:Transcript_16844/g.20228  ORF Transcript_16844/g.20228 Transcript_16844/m.20228 type:complete len:201 (+) Transcript_16844:212-814(+)